jgi:hypothetical protein
MASSATVENYFDPEDDLEQRVAAEIGKARHRVWIQAYKFSSEAIVETLLRLKRERPELDVQLSLDAAEARARSKKKQGRLVDAIAEAGGLVRFVADADKSHSKFIIVDSEVVLTGSFNFKAHADRVQRDNVVVIRSRSVAETYATRFRATLTADETGSVGRLADGMHTTTTRITAPDASNRDPAGRPVRNDSDPGQEPAEAPTAPTIWRRRGRWVLKPGYQRLSRLAPPLLAGLMLGVFSSVASQQSLDPSADVEFSGLVESMPADDMVGTWQIGGRVVWVTPVTEIERTASLPSLGTLVSVEASRLADGSIQALEIELGVD